MGSTITISDDERVIKLKALLATKKQQPDLIDLNLILSSFHSASSTQSITLSHLLLLSYYPTTTPVASSTSIKLLERVVEERLQGTNDEDLVEGFRTLSCLLKVSPTIGISLMSLKGSGVRERLEEAVEFVAGGTREGKGKRKKDVARIALVELLCSAATHSETRKMVRKTASRWLESLVRISEEGEEGQMIRALAGLTLVKLRLGTEGKDDQNGMPSVEEEDDAKIEEMDWSEDELVELFREMTLDHSSNRPILVIALEALTYLMYSAPSQRKSMLTTPPFMKVLFSILPPTLSTSTSSAEEGLDYSIASLIASLSSYPIVEQSGSSADQLRRLKAFASAKAGQSTSAPMVESTQSVAQRNLVLLAATPSPVPTLVYLARSTSPQIRHLVSSSFLAFAETTKSRGQLIQGGVAKALLNILRRVELPIEQSELPAFQALAKLLITAPPLLVLGPTEKSPFLLEAADALALPLAISEGSELVGLLLVRFECLMAITNIASLEGTISESIARKLVKSSDSVEDKGRSILNLAEELMVNDNVLVSRAATQLMCNLVSTEMGERFYVGHPVDSLSSTIDSINLSSSESTTASGATLPPRLRLLLALLSSGVLDTPTRLAASGALASLTTSPLIHVSSSVAKSLATSTEAMEKVMELISFVHEDDDREVSEGDRHGLRYRGLVILESVLGGCKDLPPQIRAVIQRVLIEGKVKEGLERAISLESDENLKQVGEQALETLIEIIQTPI